VLTLVVGRPARDRLLPLLSTLGLGRRGEQALVAWEVGPVTVVAVVVGALLGALLPFVVLQGIDLRAFTAGDAQPAVAYDPWLITAVLAGSVLVTAGRRRRGIPHRQPRERGARDAQGGGKDDPVAETMTEPHILCTDLVRIFTADGVEVQALQGLNLRVDPREMVAVVGASGSGKSTLLTILSGLDTATAGVARVAGHDLLAMGSRERVAYQRRTVGFVWQQTSRNLLPYLTAGENVALAYERRSHAPRRRAGAAGRRAARAHRRRRGPRPPTSRALGRAAAARRDRGGPRERSARAARR
jgi:hypothetical protein